jgi:ABC-type sugar transport system ATPase subunit
MSAGPEMEQHVDATARPVVRLDHIRKEFGGIEAVKDFSLDLHEGEIVALVGDNGAGKSTVVKMIAGVHQPTSGSILIDGHEVRFGNPLHAKDHGIEVVFQDLALADQQPVYMNMFLGRELVKGPFRRLDRPRMIRDAQALLSDLDINMKSPRAPIRTLSGGQRQGVAIGRATHWAQRMVLMDEPTAALGVQETSRVEETIMRMRTRGLAILVVSHNLDQVFRISDRVCVLRRGHQVGIRRTADTDADEIVSMITGARRDRADA